MHFSYPHDLDDFNYLVENFTQYKSEYVDNELRENLLVNKNRQKNTYLPNQQVSLKKLYIQISNSKEKGV